MQLTFLGTGTSFGVPVIGCSCATCTSSDPRDRRTRHGALLSLPKGNLLVDTPPELRLQLLACGIDRVDAVWYTHLHADHVHGIDDVRIFSTRGRGPVPTYVPEQLKGTMQTRFSYIFDKRAPLSVGSSKPRLTLCTYATGVATAVLGDRITAFRVPHGASTAYGFRVGSLGYVTDAKQLPREALRILDGVSTLVLNALWWGGSHAAHFNVEEAMEAAREVGARRTFLTHMTHHLRHDELSAQLPRSIRPAYDGLTIDL